MALRVSTQSTFARVLFGLRGSQFALIRAQEQVASGRRILRPSDDPSGAARVLSLSRQLAGVGRFGESIGAGINVLNTAASGLQDASNLLSDARSLLLQAMNGTLSEDDREALASEFDLLRSQMLDIGNLRSGDQHLFAGTQTDDAPWEEITIDGRRRVIYRGNGEEQLLRIGNEVDIAVNLPGSEIFARNEFTGTSFAGLTGIRGGITADEGSGYEYLDLRHDASDGSALTASGIALVAGGNGDSILGDNLLVIDAAAGTIRLGDGPVVDLPDPTSPEALDFVVENELGGELHLDLAGYVGGDVSANVRGEGSVSLDGSEYVSLDFGETDLELTDAATGVVLHLDTTEVRRAGSELVTFSGNANVFDVLQGIADDLRNGDGLAANEVVQRLSLSLEELDRGQDNLLVGLGVLGSRSQRLTVSGERAASVELQIQSQISSVRDADFAEVALDLARSSLTLQVAQASGARLIQTTILNFLQ